MGWQSRDYAQSDPVDYARGGSHYHGSGAGTFSATTALIVANIAAYIFASPGSPLFWWGVMQARAVVHGEVWRLLTSTYLHWGFSHIFVNMLTLYFFGPALERALGRRQFFLMYTLGGLAGNVLLVAAALIGWMPAQVPAAGASGSVLALLGAAAVVFPNAQVFVYFLFPMRIRTFILLYAAFFIWNITQRGSNFGGDICHLGGLLVGLWWAWSGGISISGRHRTRPHPASLLGGVLHHSDSANRLSYTRPPSVPLDPRVDAILEKVHTHGVGSLTPEERAILEDASRRSPRDG